MLRKLRPDSSGALAVHAEADREYRLIAHARDPRSAESMAGADVVIPTGKEKVGIHLVLSERYVEPVMP
jgi:hypothetical protein